MESLGDYFENQPRDLGFQPEVIPVGVSDEELVDFFMEHLSEPLREGITEQYHDTELAYYKAQAVIALAQMRDREQRERLRKFLSRE